VPFESNDSDLGESRGNGLINMKFDTLETLLEENALGEDTRQALVERIVNYFGDANLKEFVSQTTNKPLKEEKQFWCCTEEELKSMLGHCTVLERCALSTNILDVESASEKQDNYVTDSFLPSGRRGKCLSKILYRYAR
jgi:hypothetical protein